MMLLMQPCYKNLAYAYILLLVFGVWFAYLRRRSRGKKKMIMSYPVLFAPLRLIHNSW